MAMRYGKKKPEKQDMAFYLFAKLPYDVREIIWKLAAQSRTPGAHFFSTWKLDNPLPKDRLVLDKDTGDRGTPHLATPLGDNPSAYMVERRLWRTCQESAEVMLRMRHKRAKERRKMREEKRDPGMPIFSVFFEERRRITPAEGQTTLTDRYLAMPLECFPKTDLVCFERRDLKNLLRWMNNRSEMPKFFEKRFINFGLRYDKGWDKFFGNPLPPDTECPYYRRRTMDGMIFRACCKARAETFWMIDFVPRPRQGSEALVKPEYEYHGNGKRFVSVDDIKSWDFQGSRSYEFITRLGRAINAWEAAIAGHGWIRDYQHPPRKIGVLCCVE